MGVYIGTSGELKNAYIGERNPFMDYQEVEYIQSTGTQRIDTGVINNWTNLNLKLKFEVISTNGSSAEDGLFGAKGSQTTAAPTLFLPASSTKKLSSWFGSGTTYDITSSALSLNTVHDLDLTFTTTNRSWTLDGSSSSYTQSVAGGANNTNGYMTIFADGSTPVNYSKMRVYSCKLTVDGILVRDFVPCYRKSDNEIGLWDKVNNEFYPNAGTGTFTKGPDVN